MSVFGYFTESARLERLEDTGVAILRVGAGFLMLYGHGIPKVRRFSDLQSSFGDPLGIGATPSLVLAIFAEVVCAALLIPGLYARLAALPLALTMMVAGLIHHASDDFARKEKALVYLVIFLALACTGPGRYSVDHVFRHRR